MAPAGRGGSAAAPRADSGLFDVVSSSRMSEVIVEQIRSLIRADKLRPGDRLPSERDLCDQMGVSRVTVREALRVLEAAGLVAIRVGARGGAFVTTPSSTKLGANLADLVTLSPMTAPEVIEARQVVELGIIEMVIERATEEDVDELREMTREHQAALKRGEYSMEMSAAFHVRVAKCAHNAAIEMLVHSFHGPLLMSLREAQVAAPLMGHRGTSEHREFVEAIGARDAEKARDIMAKHLRRTSQRIARVQASREKGNED
ncbi:FadR/GntR family transcriptional regulator [Amycolatopsis sp. FDAARGOS 1241]|uniref:FadR/GntR family transcriptional regulator n=1 Tax=Amycolatopsis sp. FDAARGOS 1241 TaxID=2778070 RepID=UPI001950A93E|nr:FadR/GntR family transcriptional regulator [Amycolatopsis sp. FDAARGOS 1241]QRP50447.1 FadR family transcriptional regulator [Amycolatopsis sp. FDAARGOS 1241]